MLGVFSAVFSEAASPDAGAKTKLYSFYGKVQAVNPAANEITIRTKKGAFTFTVTNGTKIMKNGRVATLADATAGEHAEVFMRIGDDRKGIAVSVTLASGEGMLAALSMCVATTPSGDNVSGLEVNRFVVYEPPREPFRRGINFGPLKQGFFLLSVRPDGTVSNVEVVNSIGVSELDNRAMKWLMRWRFRPNSVVKVKMPATFN